MLFIFAPSGAVTFNAVYFCFQSSNYFYCCLFLPPAEQLLFMLFIFAPSRAVTFNAVYFCPQLSSSCHLLLKDVIDNVGETND
jgi:hypothetical protein